MATRFNVAITTEDPEQNFTPDYGRITAYRSAAGFGIRLDGGTAYAGAVITPYYDSLLVKVTAWAQTPEEASQRMDRALARIPRARRRPPTWRFWKTWSITLPSSPANAPRVSSTKPLSCSPSPKRRDRATRLLRFIGEVTVNGNPEMKGRALARAPFATPPHPAST